jgi:hypothetical protein
VPIYIFYWNKRRVKGCEKWGRFKVLETERRVKGWEKG